MELQESKSQFVVIRATDLTFGGLMLIFTSWRSSSCSTGA